MIFMLIRGSQQVAQDKFDTLISKIKFNKVILLQ